MCEQSKPTYRVIRQDYDGNGALWVNVYSRLPVANIPVLLTIEDDRGLRSVVMAKRCRVKASTQYVWMLTNPSDIVVEGVKVISWRRAPEPDTWTAKGAQS